MKVHLIPAFDSPDKGEGGIRRVVESQLRSMPALGYEFVDTEEEADIVAVHGGAFCATRKPLVSHNHGLYWEEYQWPKWADELNRRVVKNLHLADAVTAPSEWVAQAIRRGTLIDAVPIHHGIDVSEWHSSQSPDKTQVLWNKARVDTICDPTPAMDLAAAAPHVRVVSTFGTPRSNNVDLVGRMPFARMKHLIQTSHIYLCTTRETFGIGTLEAMASGSVVLGWAWGAQREFITHKENGYLATPGSDLLEGLEYCLQHFERMSAASIATAAKYTHEAAAAKYAEVYERVYEARPRKRISVIVTCYNLAETLPRAVESVDSKDTEVIIVDDCSPDETRTVAKKLMQTHKHVQYVRNPTNQYLAGALDAGISIAKGRYIVPLDADNAMLPGMLDILANELDRSHGHEDKHIDIAYGRMLVHNTDGTSFVSSWPPEQFSLRAQLEHKNQITSTAMYRRKIWERVRGYRRRCPTAEDADFWCRATSYGAIPKLVTEAPVFEYFNRDDSMSRTVKDWAWHHWYPWPKYPTLLPYIAAASQQKLRVRSYEPTTVTVVIPVGPGHDKFVVDAIDSLLAQTFTRWHLIVVNNSGGPLPKVPSFAEIITLPGGIGVAEARNAGLARVNTPWWIPLDADDYLQPEALEIMIESATEKNGYYYCDWIKSEAQEIHETEDFSCDMWLTKFRHAVTALYPTQASKDVGGFDTTPQYWEDWDFALRLVEHGVCPIRIPLPLFYYRMGTGNRREELYAQRVEMVERIKERWGVYLRGEKSLMGCGCSGKRVVISTPPQSQSVAPITGDMILLQYTVSGAPSVRYTGAATGHSYKFDGGGRAMQWVHASDAPGLLALNGKFRVPNEEKKLDKLVAAGPPRGSS